MQYWRCFDHLEALANDTSDPHVAGGGATGSASAPSTRTGIWHETYLFRADEYEAIYGNMPPFGLGKASRLVPLADAKTARDGSGPRQAVPSASPTDPGGVAAPVS